MRIKVEIELYSNILTASGARACSLVGAPSTRAT